MIDSTIVRAHPARGGYKKGVQNQALGYAWGVLAGDFQQKFMRLMMRLATQFNLFLQAGKRLIIRKRFPF